MLKSLATLSTSKHSKIFFLLVFLVNGNSKTVEKF